jgi:hypothetical protein
VVHAVAREQAGGISYDALWRENERLKAENAALWQAWSDAADLSEAKQRAANPAMTSLPPVCT